MLHRMLNEMPEDQRAAFLKEALLGLPVEAREAITQELVSNPQQVPEPTTHPAFGDGSEAEAFEFETDEAALPVEKVAPVASEPVIENPVSQQPTPIAPETAVESDTSEPTPSNPNVDDQFHQILRQHQMTDTESDVKRQFASCMGLGVLVAIGGGLLLVGGAMALRWLTGLVN